MSSLFKYFIPVLFLLSCTSVGKTGTYSNSFVPGYRGNSYDTVITESLFIDKASTISEENIQKILDGSYKLPEKLRVAIIKLDNSYKKSYYWNDEDYLKTQQSYIDLVSEHLKTSARVVKTATIPEILLPKASGFTNIREAAVRMQSDIVVIFSVTSDLYSKYKLFSKDDIKAFATTQLIVLDVRTGLVPYSGIVTKDVLSQKKNGETDVYEARRRIQHEAVLLTLDELGKRLSGFLKQ